MKTKLLEPRLDLGDLGKPVGPSLNMTSDIPKEFICINLVSLMSFLQFCLTDVPKFPWYISFVLPMSNPAQSRLCGSDTQKKDEKGRQRTTRAWGLVSKGDYRTSASEQEL